MLIETVDSFIRLTGKTQEFYEMKRVFIDGKERCGSKEERDKRGSRSECAARYYISAGTGFSGVILEEKRKGSLPDFVKQTLTET